MLFNSFAFIALFLPIVLIVFFAAGRVGRLRLALAWLVVASLFYYGWWNPAYLALIIGSVLVNHRIGAILCGPAFSAKRRLLTLGVTLNLGFLGYFKYTEFAVENLAWATGLGLSIVRDVVEGSGGTVHAANRDGGGAAIGFTLPTAC